MKDNLAKKAAHLLWIIIIALSPLMLAGKSHAAIAVNLALNKNVSAQSSCCTETPAETVDGDFSYVDSPHNRWTDYGQGGSTNWLAIDFGESTTFNQVKLYVYNDNGGVQPPASYVIQYRSNGTNWTNVTGETHNPATPVEKENTANFETVTAQYARVVLTHGAAAVGLTEIEVYHDTDVENAFAANAVTAQIDSLPASSAVTLTDQTAISAARTAYNRLTATQQSMVTNVSKLTADESAIDLLLYRDVTVQSAFGSLNGDTVTVRLTSVLDATYGVQADKFQLAVNGAQVAVTSAVYDAADPTLHTMQLTLASAALQHATSAAIVIQKGALKTDSGTYNNTTASFPVIPLSKLDINADSRIGIDDVAQIVTTPTLQVDMDQDGSFGLGDIESILEQLSTVQH